MNNELYDRLEVLWEFYEMEGIPQPCDDDYWDGVLETPSSPAKGEHA